MQSFRISESSSVAATRRAALELAKSIGFSVDDNGRLSIIVTELATNLLKHAGHGEMLIGNASNTASPALEIFSLDKGPGMNLDRCIVDGFSTAGSQGTGLGAVRRQASTFEGYSVPGSGSVLHVRVCAEGSPYRSKTVIPWAAVARPLHGEEVCGDAVAVREENGYFLALIADGLGHGPSAAQASMEAVTAFERDRSVSPLDLIESIHAALKVTRGAAVAVASMAFQTRTATYCGIGNTVGSVHGTGHPRKMISLNGTAGVVARKIQEFHYAFEADGLLILHTDGLSASWALEKLPGLALHSPALIAAVLYRDFSRERDDATVLVARLLS